MPFSTPPDVDAIATNSEAAATDAEQVETHFHNREYWFGKLGVQTATNWGQRASLTPYVVTSGNGDFGTDPGDAAQVLGSADTPVRAGSTVFDMRRMSIVDVSTVTVWILRIIHGTGTIDEAEAAGQYTEITAQQPTANGQNKPADMWCERLAVGEQVWVKGKNATNNATLQFLVGLHEYPAPAQP